MAAENLYLALRLMPVNKLLEPGLLNVVCTQAVNSFVNKILHYFLGKDVYDALDSSLSGP
jgi:hypothetical protein